jgi:hypothetical protein
MKFIKASLAATISALALGSAHAEVVTFEFTATISNIFQFDPNLPLLTDSVDVLGSTIRTSETVHGTMSYDTSAPVWVIQKRVAMPLVFYKDMGSMTLTFEGGLHFDSSNIAETPQMSVGDNSTTYRGADTFGFSTASRITPEQNATLFLVDRSGTAFDGNTLPGNLDLSRFSQRTLYYYFGADEQAIEVDATITSLQLLSPVPEPDTYLMMAGGLGLLAWRRRNTHKQRATV